MKPDWDKLAKEYKGSEAVLIADVDCTAAGEPLCKEHGVSGYPTLKTFASSTAKGVDYQGGRSLSALRAHAQTLGPFEYTMPMKVGMGVGTIFVVWVLGSFLRIFP
jgi:hypothetical protein